MKHFIDYQEDVMKIKEQVIEITDINALKLMIEDLRREIERMKATNKLK